MSNTEIRRVIVLPDMHIPFEDKKSLKAVEKFIADYRWDDYVCLGDLLDFDQLSKFNKDNLRKLDGRRVLKDYEIANQILDRHQNIIRAKNPDCTFTLLQGNHCERIERFIDKVPSFEGILEVEIGLRLKERGFKWVRSWTNRELHRIGKLHFSHGDYVGKYHASKMIDNYGVNIAYGHTHDIQNYTKTILGKDKHIMAQSLGYLADESKLDYMKNRPNNWCQAIGVAFVQPNGSFNLQVITIINHKFVWEGKLYDSL